MQTSTDIKTMHDSQKLADFIAFRANGWSLVEISYRTNIPKSTLWEWDNKHRDQINRLKQLQLEKFKHRFLPTLEDELAKLRLYLGAIEAALQKSRFDELHPGYLLQLSLQLRNRLARVCAQEPLGDTAADPLPLNGCITSRYQDQFTEQDIAQFVPASDQGQANPEKHNQAKPDGTPPSPQNGSLIVNDLQQLSGQARPVLPPEK